MTALGFGQTMLKFQDLVKNFVEMKSIKTQFTDNRPGYDWVQFFLKYHTLSSKKGRQMQLARKNVTSDIGKSDTATGYQRPTRMCLQL